MTQPMSNEREEQEQAPERLWVELRTQHAFTIQPEPYVETVAYIPVDVFNAQYEGLMRAALLREQNAATAMRDKCVAKVQELARAHRLLAQTTEGATSELQKVRAEECDEIAVALQSLTLDQVEQTQ